MVFRNVSVHVGQSVSVHVQKERSYAGEECQHRIYTCMHIYISLLSIVKTRHVQMYVFTYAYVYIYIYIDIYTHTSIYIYTCIRTYIYIYI